MMKLRNKIILSISSIILYILLFITFIYKTGGTAGALVTIPVIVIGYSFGIYGGIIVGILSLPFNILLFDMARLDMLSGIFNFIILSVEVLIGVTVGLLSDLKKRLQREIVYRNEVEEKLRFLATIDEMTITLNRRTGLSVLENQI